MIYATGITIGDPIWKAMEGWLYKFKQNNVKTATFERLLTSYRMMRGYSVSYVVSASKPENTVFTRHFA